MKMLMLKQKLKTKTNVKMLAGALSVIGVLLIASVYSVFVQADQYDDQIRAIQQDSTAKRAISNDLANQARSYQEAINALEQRINALQQSIVSTQNQSDEVQRQITVAQAELDRQRHVLGTNIKTMYLEGQISTLEILASSTDLSDFINKEEYRTAVQNQIKTTVDKISQLKVQLEQKKRELENLLKDLQTQQAQLNADEAQQSQMLAYTEGQKAAYDQQIRANNTQIASLRAQQAAANRGLGVPISGDPGHGGYPAVWDRAPQDSLIDSWGMFNRECVSYTAWKVYQTYGYMPYWGGHGNANQWPASAIADGIPTGTTPRPNSVAISMGGYYGHAMWVEAVNGNTIYVSQYNFDLQGHYSEMSTSASGLIYIYFGG
jgi:surface antigen/peptidoglycan hydrolase CwlO-like protein